MLEIKGTAAYDGTLRLNFAGNFVPKGKVTIIRSGNDKKSGEFEPIETVGLPEQYQVNVTYTTRINQLEITKK